MKSFKKLIVLVMTLSLLVACSAKNSIENAYPLVDVLNDDVGNESSVYLAEGDSVPVTAKKIAAANKPVEISKEDEEKCSWSMMII
ncbi:DUF4247 domain-containing protein [Metabacillus herbersteinensis]|uniref:DUF4247 domain-containing protein n=1 Tax=Metabacillus herbersteinensis TaxID=283816 RepID=A0ABV6GG29_9BACI